VTLTIDPGRTAIPPLDLQHDNIVATPRSGEKKILPSLATVAGLDDVLAALG
jgi:hypothetical protein